MNSKNVAVGNEQDIRRSRWLGKGLIVEVNEKGQRRYFGIVMSVVNVLSIGLHRRLFQTS